MECFFIFSFIKVYHLKKLHISTLQCITYHMPSKAGILKSSSKMSLFLHNLKYENLILLILIQTSIVIVLQLILNLFKNKNIKYILTKIKLLWPGQQG
jgi:hypothetical protein